MFCIKSRPSTKTDCVLLFACTVELLNSATKIITFLQILPSGCVKLPVESNPIP